jgi:hypothetical protein
VTNVANTLGGSISWSRNPQALATQRSYKAGFVPAMPLTHNAVTLTAVGGRYNVPATDAFPASALPLALPDNASNARLAFTPAITGLIPSPSPNIVLTRLKADATTALPLAAGGSNPRTVTFKLTQKTGAFAGTMIITDVIMGATVKRTPNPAFKGFVVNDEGTLRGLGFFILQDLPTVTVPVTKTDLLSCSAVLEAN